MSASSITAAILAGGLGTRLRAAVADKPKVLAPVSGKPFLAYLLDHLERYGFQRVVLCTGYRHEQVHAAFGKQNHNLQIDYSVETAPLGTGGAIRNALDQFASGPVLVLNGDSFCPFDLGLYLSWHRAQKSRTSLALISVPDAARFGRVQVRPDGAIERFDEKDPGATGPAWINAGVYLLSRELIQAIPPGRAVSIEREVFPAAIGDGGLNGYRVEAPFLDIGTPESFALAEAFLGALDRSGQGRAAVKRQRKGGAVLLDRDGVLNVECHYLSHPDQVELLPGVAQGLRHLQALGLSLAVVTNQSGVGRGYFDLDRLNQVHDRLRALLQEQGVTLDGIYYCPHVPEDACACRKPAIGLAAQAASELGFDASRTFMIGDKACDIDMGRRYGSTTILVTTGYGARALASGAIQADYVADDLVEAARLIESIQERWALPG
jgi:histidinol-phosphate phosphatase family protein